MPLSKPASARTNSRLSRARIGSAAAAFGAVVPLATVLAGCQALQTSDSIFGIITPYRIDVVQGNVITQEQAALMRPGLTRAQVRDALGSPLLTDVFHANRWDYVFTIRRQGAAPQQRRVVVLFEGDVMASIDTGGELPSERDFVASIDTFKTSRDAPPLALTEEQVKALPVPARPAPPEPEASAPLRNYPPLEPRS